MLGVYVQNRPDQLDRFEGWLGRPVDYIHSFLNFSSWSAMLDSANWLVNQLYDDSDASKQRFYSVPLIVTGETLAEASDGDFNAYWRQAAQTIANGTTGDDPIYIRTGWELNGKGWFPWSATGHVTDFVEAFREFVTVFRSVSDRFRFEWNINEAWGGLDPATAYPGDAYVDVIGMDFYWRPQYQGTDPVAAFNTLVYREKYGLQWLENFAAQHNKPTGYSEWSITGDNAAPFLRLVSDWIKSHNVLYQGYWDALHGGNDGMLSDGTEPNSGAAFRSLFGAQPGFNVPTGTVAQSGYSGAVAIGADLVNIPAWKFDFGGQGVSFSDTTATQDLGGSQGRNAGVDIVGDNAAIGWIANGEWVEYTVNVAAAGSYALKFVTSAADAGRSVTASFWQGGTNYRSSAAVSVADTNDQSFSTSNTTVDLRSGVQVVRLTFNGGDFDLAAWQLDRIETAPSSSQRAYDTTAPVVGSSPVTIPAWKFDVGGQGIAYNDVDATDRGGSLGRNTTVDVIGDNGAIGWIANGEWVEYTLNVASAGRYELTFTASSDGGGGTIGTTLFQGSSVRNGGSTSVFDTGSFLNFMPTTPIDLDLQAGVQTLRLNFSGGYDLRSFEIDKVEGFAPDADLMFRTSAAGSAALLENRVVRGDIYVYVPTEPNIDKVEFYINRTPGNEVRPSWVENFEPYQLLDGGAYDTRRLEEGWNRITTVLTSYDDQKQTIQTDFFVDNIA